MKRFRVETTEKALNDLATQVEWWSGNRSAEQAERWYDEIMLSMRSLSTLPNRCPILIGANFEREVRSLLFGLGPGVTHRIYFTINDQTVTVLRVRHTAQQELVSEGDL
ncbi:type II toxin-antitoxin system RelE/ParE family toxin [Rhodopirellula bahusiensis]|uniref:type II toxin-antitoxin system RelE/ParE family toxin n=1 Tax=Rhodopirellula bahusiensis TaxID=2014065 RepID=UPI003266FA43